jgi:large subunit ribosomal protein L25
MAKHRPTVQAAARQRTGSVHAARLRRDGKLPAVVYGHKKDPAHVVIDKTEFTEHLHEGTHLIDLATDGAAAQTCLIKDVQYDYLGTHIIHVDFARVDLTEVISVSVPLIYKGQDVSPGAKTPGAIVEHRLLDLIVQCRADSIPESIIVDLSKLELDGTITVSQLPLPAGVTTTNNPKDVVVSIHVAAEEAEPVVAETTVAEPEVLTAKKEEEGAAPAAGGKDAKPAAKPAAKK